MAERSHEMNGPLVEVALLRERQEGHYYGLGISINVVDGDITVTRVFEGSPAYGKGIRRGDVIARIDRDRVVLDLRTVSPDEDELLERLLTTSDR